MDSINVVIDTNIVVAALRSRRGASHKFLNLLGDGLYTPNLSVPLFIEYESLLKRDGLVSLLTSEDIDDILDYVLSQSRIREIHYLWRPYLRDPKDDLVLEVAVESASRSIITFNKKDFRGVDKFGLRVLTPHEFLRERGVIE